MKSLFGKVICAGALICCLSDAGFAQTIPQVDLFLTGGPNRGTYPGYVMTGTYDVTFSNATGVTLLPHAFSISLALPSGFEFDQAYPALPANWSYTRTSLTSILLEPVTAVGAFTIISFSVPFKTTGPVNNQTYQGQIFQNIPMYIDPNPGNNSPTGTVSVTGIPLPVAFGPFSATAKGCDVAVDWITLNEIRNDYFSVERSSDGARFESIAKIKSQGSGSEERQYHYTDAHPLKGKNYYRVVQYDVDGKSLMTTIADAATNCDQSLIDLYPNPATDKIFVRGMQGENTIRVFNSLGQVIIEEATDLAIQSVNTAGIASGTYHLQVVKGTQIVFNGKFVKAE